MSPRITGEVSVSLTGSRSPTREIPAPSALYGFEKRPVYLGIFPTTAALIVTAIAVPLHQPTMPRAKWYSPQLRRDLVTQLYFRARAEGIPMTRLADRLIAEALARPAVVHGELTARVAEEPPPASVPG